MESKRKLKLGTQRLAIFLVIVTVLQFSGFGGTILEKLGAPQIADSLRINEAHAANTVIFIATTASTTWVVPSDWNSASNTIEVVGGGGGRGNNSSGAGGGGGGAYSKATNVTLTAGGTVTIAVGTGGAATVAGGDTFVCNATANCASIAGTAVVAGAKGGSGGSGATGGAGGATSTAVGAVKNSGGTGGTGGAVGPSGGGGGGAGAPGGAGLNGGAGGSDIGGGGGGGAGGASSTAGVAGNSASGGNGGNGQAGTGGGLGGAPGGAGSNGGGGGGGNEASNGGNGGAGTEWDATHGAGGGGGSSGDPSAPGTTGGTGALYGGGGGGGNTGGTGAQGIIVITYTPSGGGVTTLTQEHYRWYGNADSITPSTTALAALDATSTNVASGTAVRLRMNVGDTGAALAATTRTFQLQYSTSTTGGWANVAATGTATIWRGYDNPTPANGATVSSTLLLASSSAAESYVEAGSSPSNPTAIAVGGWGEWDWALQQNGAATNTTYYFRMVNSSGTALDAYTRYPSLTTQALPSTPGAAPTYTSIATSTLTVNWTTATSSDYYKLERGTSTQVYAQITTTTALTFPDTGLTASTTYYYRYRGTNAVGDGAYSASSSVTTASSSVPTPDATSVTYTVGGDGGRSGNSSTITGTNFGTVAAGSRANCAGGAGTGCVQFLGISGNATATVADADVTAWSATSITFNVSTTLATLGGAASLQVCGAGVCDSTPLTFFVYPKVTGMATCANCSANATREYSTSTGDTDGLFMLNGDHFGLATGTITFTGGFGSLSGMIHTVVEGACTTSGWKGSATSSNSICVEATSSISDSVYTGTVTLTRNADSKTDASSSLRILPRITSNNPVSTSTGNVVQILGNHFCETGTCPVSPNRATSTDNVKFGVTTSTDSDFQNLTGGAGACNGTSAAWTHTEICVKVPAAASGGSASTTVTSNLLTSNKKDFNVVATTTLTQANYQWYTNIASTTPGGSLVALNTAATNVATGTVVRLRIDVQATGTTLSATAFKLQFSTSTSGGWADVGATSSATIWRGYDNATTTSGGGGAILEASATATTTTTSTTDVLMTGMTLTPGAGDYLAVFSTSVKNDGVVQSNIFASIYVNGVQQAHTERRVLQEASIFGTEQPLMTYAHITVGAGQAVEIKWRTDVANTVTADARTLNLFPVASADVSQATSTVDTTLNSSTYTLLNSMTLSPAAGTYLALFSASVESAVAESIIDTSLFVGGVQVAHTERSLTEETSIPSTPFVHAILAKVAPTAGQAVEVRWRNSGAAGIITAHQRTLTLYKVDAANIFEATDTADTTSTATTDALLPSMTLTPGAGDYLALFSSSFFYGTIAVSPVTFHSFYVNGVKIAHTERQPVHEASIDLTNIPVATNGLVSPGASQAVEVRWRSSTADLRTAHERTFTLLKAAAGTSTTDIVTGSTLPSLLLASSTIKETYEEYNPSASIPNGIPAGGYGEWDWVAQNNNASSGVTYYFRMVQSSGTVLDAYSQYPTITTAGGGPLSPANLNQFTGDGVTQINVGSSTATTTVVLKADVSASQSINMALQVEATSTANAFACGSGACAIATQSVTYNSTTSVTGASTTLTLTSAGDSGTNYHWQARVRNTGTNEYSSWVSFPSVATNTESVADFNLDVNPPAITSLAASPVGSSTATITWNTSGESATAQVQYFMNGNFNSVCQYETSTVAMPAAGYQHSSVVSNGYVYAIGGTSGGLTTSSVLYALINATGSLGSWQTATSSLPAVRYYHSSVVSNGYVYAIGGADSVAATSSVLYALVNATGSLGSWQTATVLPAVRLGHSSVVSNGYVYAIGGSSGGPTSSVLYALINATGSLGSWQTATSSLPAARYDHSSVVSNGYVYAIGGRDSLDIATSSVLYALVNATGSLGSWQTATVLPAARYYHSSVVSNGYAYAIGGADSAAATTSTVSYAPLDCTAISALNAPGAQSVNLVQLSTSTTYYFRARSKDQVNNESISATSSFLTTSTVTLPVTGQVASAISDTGAVNGAAYNSIMWEGTSGTGKVRFQLATSNSTSGPWTFIGGPTCTGSDYYDPGAPDTPVELTCAPQNHNNQRYFKYLVQICSNSDCSTAGITSPTVTSVVVNWSP